MSQSYQTTFPDLYNSFKKALNINNDMQPGDNPFIVACIDICEKHADNKFTPINFHKEDWCKPDENGIIHVPDELDPLVNKFGFHYRIHTISKRTSEPEMVCRMVRDSEIFFNEKLRKPKEEEMFLNMQYYMEYCQTKGYVTPQEWIEKHKHF